MISAVIIGLQILVVHCCWSYPSVIRGYTYINSRGGGMMEQWLKNGRNQITDSPHTPLRRPPLCKAHHLLLTHWHQCHLILLPINLQYIQFYIRPPHLAFARRWASHSLISYHCHLILLSIKPELVSFSYLLCELGFLVLEMQEHSLEDLWMHGKNLRWLENPLNRPGWTLEGSWRTNAILVCCFCLIHQYILKNWGRFGTRQTWPVLG